MRHQGTPEEKRQKAQTDQADYHVGFGLSWSDYSSQLQPGSY